ncbi:unnamed protein product [Pleuronectes platessa]|uniref:Uncharacterized protein n=1 Tax=Pleuronectes platessa TaxID=8262 RepID=A0A9N7VUK0_PLEPL|nr:unnamed protein product [Pleuronectes platessa]
MGVDGSQRIGAALTPRFGVASASGVNPALSLKHASAFSRALTKQDCRVAPRPAECHPEGATDSRSDQQLTQRSAGQKDGDTAETETQLTVGSPPEELESDVPL